MPVRTLEDELIQIFASTASGRNRDILIGYYGWQDGQRHTLAEIGARYGMTRERTRQICAKLVQRRASAATASPVMDRTLAMLAEHLPAPAEQLEALMRQVGLTRVGLRLENVHSAARLLGREVPFRVVRVGRRLLAVRPAQVRLPPVIAELARKEVYYHGLSTVEQIRQAVAARETEPVGTDLVGATIQLMEGFCWLDRQAGWFRLATRSKHGLPRAIDKILAVAGPIRVAELRAAVRRNRRIWPVLPPEPVLLEFCRQMPGVRVQGDVVLADPPRPWRKVLTGVEAKLVEILQEHGPVMERGKLEDLCVASGMNRFSFHAFVACSPVIAQYGHSVYGLLGAEVAPEHVQSLLDKRRQQRVPARVLNRHGRTPDGRYWLSYRLSKAASTYAVITVPAVLKNVVCGQFRLVSPEGQPVGTLAAKDGRAWGLGAYLRRCGAQVNDQVLLTLDLRDRTAVITLGQGAPGEPRHQRAQPPA